MIRDLNCTQFQATIGLSVYPLGFGVIPLATAALSEEFGRQPLYLGSALIFMLMHLGIALYVLIPENKLCLPNLNLIPHVHGSPNLNSSFFLQRKEYPDRPHSSLHPRCCRFHGFDHGRRNHR